MNMWTKFYGFVGLVSTMGKNSFDFSARVNKLSEKTCYYAEKAFEKLQEASEKAKDAWSWSAEQNEKAREKCQEWEKWAEKNWEEAKQQEELNESWNELNGKLSINDKLLREEKRQKEEIAPRPSYLRNILSLY